MNERKRVNSYRCDTCGKDTVTIDRDEGVTPFILGCRVTAGCSGMGTSAMYKPGEKRRPTHEWFSPNEQERKRLSRGMLEHVIRGGLDIRPIRPETLAHFGYVDQAG